MICVIGGKVVRWSSYFEYFLMKKMLCIDMGLTLRDAELMSGMYVHSRR